MSYTAIQLGGLGKTVRNARHNSMPVISDHGPTQTTEIGIVLSASGLFAAIVQPFLFPWLSARIRTKTLYKFAFAIYPFLYLCLPLLNVLARAGGPDPEHLEWWADPALWTGIAFVMILSRTGSLAYACACSPFSTF